MSNYELVKIGLFSIGVMLVVFGFLKTLTMLLDWKIRSLERKLKALEDKDKQ